MTTASDQFWQGQIVREVGDPNGTIDVVVAELWPYYADRAAIHPILQVLYVKRAAIDQRLAEEQAQFDFTAGKDRVFRSQKFAHLQQMRDEVQAEITRREAIERSTRAPQTATITKVAPQSPPDIDQADANDPLYQGSPYEREVHW
jgi:predicted Abi (CAAX) family protease